MIKNETDIKRRKSLGVDAMNKLKNMLRNYRTSKTKEYSMYFKVFNCFSLQFGTVGFKQSLEEIVDSFDRRLLRIG